MFQDQKINGPPFWTLNLTALPQGYCLSPQVHVLGSALVKPDEVHVPVQSLQLVPKEKC
jgi:hypothetical protein